MGSSSRHESSAFSQLGVPDPAALAARILAARRLGPRMRVALLLYLEGLSTREAARAVGFKSHMALWRAAGRYGLHAVHKQRQAYRKAATKLAQAQELLQRRRKGPLTPLRAFELAIEAHEVLNKPLPSL
jgi:transposase